MRNSLFSSPTGSKQTPAQVGSRLPGSSPNGPYVSCATCMEDILGFHHLRQSTSSMQPLRPGRRGGATNAVPPTIGISLPSTRKHPTSCSSHFRCLFLSCQTNFPLPPLPSSPPSSLPPNPSDAAADAPPMRALCTLILGLGLARFTSGNAVPALAFGALVTLMHSLQWDRIRRCEHTSEPLHSLHSLRRRRCSHTPEPPQSVQRERLRLCSQIDEPMQIVHWPLRRLCMHIADPLHSLH